MAQSFHAVSTSLGEAERQKDGKNWTAKEYKAHSKHYNIDQQRAYLNTVFVSANGKNERELVNDLLHEKMLELNAEKVQKVADWNAIHFGNVNPKTGKEYRKKSVDKREVYPVGKYAKTGKRKLPYDVYKGLIEKGNARGKNNDSSRYRTGVLQQIVVGFGNDEEWQNDGVRKYFLDEINSGDKKRATAARNLFNEKYAKPWLEKFKAENPSMKIVQAVVHFDETHPHMQITVMPYVAGKENGGLGSTSYTGAIKHDHPDLKGNVIAEWYRTQHEKLRNLIANTPSGLAYNSNHKPATMTLGDRPGSHKSTRVNLFNKQQADLLKQQKYLDEQKVKTANEAIATIKAIQPEHTVPLERLKPHETAKRIDTPEGEEQHRTQPLEWLTKAAREVLRLARIRITNLQRTLNIRDKERAERERKIFEAGKQSERNKNNQKNKGLER